MEDILEWILRAGVAAAVEKSRRGCELRDGTDVGGIVVLLLEGECRLMAEAAETDRGIER